MLIDFDILEKKYGIIPEGVIHVGMHEAEEYPIYEKAGVRSIIFIEANPILANILHYDFHDDVYVVNAAVSDKREKVTFNVTNNGQSSSILNLKDHSQIYPGIVVSDQYEVTTRTLAEVCDHCSLNPAFMNYVFNVINLDIQGAELKALKGLHEYWENIEAVFTEVNYREMYEGCALVGEMDEFLEEKGFKKVEEVDTGAGWGDALYIKTTCLTE